MHRQVDELPETKRLLCVVAHPDDETFGAGGILIHAAAIGAEVYVACATRGDVGEIAERSDATPETLPQVREREFHDAGKLMGMKRSVILGYRDSGMAGTDENKDPRALINQPKEKVTAEIVGLINEVRPHVVLTMDEGGGYGHPDHIFMSESTLAAFEQCSADASGWSPSKLYYFGFPRSQMRDWIEDVRARDPEDSFAKMDPEELGVADERISLHLDTSAHAETWKRAIAAHKSQYSPIDFMPDDLQKGYLGNGYLIRVIPHWNGGAEERGIFEEV